MLRFILGLTALILGFSGCVSVPVADKAGQEPQDCFGDACCGNAASTSFPPHRLRCEGLAAEKTSLWAQAERLYAEAARQARSAEGSEARQVLCLSLIDSARLAHTRGVLAKARDSYVEAVKTCSTVSGAKGDETARARIGLADVLLDSGRAKEARAVLEPLAGGFLRYEDKALRAAALDAFARLEDEAGNHAKARDWLNQALALRQQLFGEHGLEASLTMKHLGDNAMRLHGWNDARGWYLRALVGVEQSLDKRSHPYASVKAALAANYLKDRRYDTLPALYEELIVLGREVYGPASAEFAQALYDSAAFLYTQRRYAQAFERFRQAAEIRRRTMPGSLALGWASLHAAKAKLEIDHCGPAWSFLIEAQDILNHERLAGSETPDLNEFGNEFGRVARFCATKPRPELSKPVGSRGKRSGRR